VVVEASEGEVEGGRQRGKERGIVAVEEAERRQRGGGRREAERKREGHSGGRGEGGRQREKERGIVAVGRQRGVRGEAEGGGEEREGRGYLIDSQASRGHIGGRLFHCFPDLVEI
jgi:hypothetical protein